MNSKKNLKRNLLICLLAGSAVMYTLPLHAATSVVANNALPQNGQFFNGNKFIQGTANEKGNGFDFAGIGSITKPNDLTMNVHQNNQNAVIKWDSFNVGGSATVNFTSDAAQFNTLNYVNSGAASQIYGTINAVGGNIFVVNPAGVQIGNSAQINVGSLYVSSNTLDDKALTSFYNNAHTNNFTLGGTRNADIELMSLGNINANKVTFEGNGRIVIDSERIKDVAGTEKLTADKIFVNTKDENNLVIGYDGYDENNGGSYNTASEDINIVTVNGNGFAQNKGYMWVEDVEQLQAINTNLEGNYALRNSIDATATSSWDDNDNDNINEGFKQIGTEINNAFTGKFDGLDYNIFGLTINRSNEEDVGLFGVVNGATINNVTLVGGSITGNYRVGGIVGNAIGKNTVISNATNSASVTGNSQVGGIVGIITGNSDNKSKVNNVINTGTINGNAGNDVGGLIGSLNNSQLTGNSYNLGAVTSSGHDVGGLVGSASNSTIGDGTNLVYNRLDVTGAYNVGGIVGNMEGSTVQNAENSGNVTASGYDKGKYIFHTDYNVAGYSDNGIKTVDVNVANVGGIAGKADDTVDKVSEIKNVTNSGNVSSNKQENNDYYDAGNVGGIVGSAVDTNITNATNRENEVRGAHNVGGVAGYFGNSSDDKSSPHYTVTNGINDGGDIMATGARYKDDFVRETIRYDYGADNNDGNYIIGNIGGVVGYMDGNNVYVTQSANRGTVHTLDITDQSKISNASTAANVGGIVGKLDTDRNSDKTDKEILEGLQNGSIKAAVSNSYNTGDVRGYTAIGGIVGMMYNGEIAGSYNLGEIRSTRIAVGNETPLNMGGIVGDTTENSTARAYLYDVYNKGQIGDETYTYKGRHVGGIAGRLSGTIEKAYNSGAIYNGAAVTGGIVGYLSVGSIKNVFNTGNITVENNDGENLGTQLGGLVGAANIGRGSSAITNAYNLGVIRSFNGTKTQHNVGGIVGAVVNYSSGLDGESKKNLNINNVYTTGDLYSHSGSVGAVYGSIFREVDSAADITISNVVYITPTNKDYSKAVLPNVTTQIGGVYGENTAVAWNDFINAAGSDLWRVYDGTTPILNEYLPNSEKYFGDVDKYHKGHGSGIDSIQYGTAYNPLLTIIEASKDLSFDWQDLGINNDAGLAVYGAGVTLDNFKATGGTGYYGGLIYADGNLNLDGKSNDISLGSASQIYGSSVTIKTDGKVTIYGDVTATGNATGGKSAGDITVTGGDVDVYGQLTSATEGEATNIAGIGKKYGTINNVGDIKNKYDDIANMGDHYAHTTGEAAENGDITIEATETKLVVDDNGDPILDANGNMQYIDDGDVNIYYGNKEQELITTGGDLTVTGTGDVYVDSDLDIGGDLTLEGTGADSEVVLDITNIGQVRGEEYISRLEDAVRGIELTNSNRENIINAILEAGITNDQQEAGRLAARLINSSFEDFGDEKSLEYFHEFMHHFSKVGFGDGTQAGNAKITLNAGQSGNTKLTIDMWNDVTETYDLTKYDEKNTASSNNHTLLNELNNLNIVASTLDTDGGVENTDKVQKVTYIWVSSGEQLKNIQTYYKTETDAGRTTGILGYNFALKNDINASDVSGYVAIGTGNKDASGNEIGFTGTFDGRGNRIIGLNVSGDDAGIFSTVGTNTVNNNDGTTTTYTGTVKDVNIYSGTFTGKTTAGAVAGENNGRIEGIVTFGNTVTVTGDNSNVSNAGGIVGVNNSGIFENNANDGELTGGIYDVESTGSVIAGSSDAVAGGLVGTNNGGLANSFSDSAVTVKVDNQKPVTTTGGLGGVVGVNTEKGNVQYVDSLGVTNGGATGSSNIGGIIGTNNGNMYSGYNESIVSGANNVGGIIGENEGKYENDKWNGGTVANVVNATGVTGTGNNVGGLVGVNSGSVTNGRNNGTITGVKYVGGMVGSNEAGATLTNLVNDSSAEILGVNYVGGIAGNNSGVITADKNNDNLINRGSITGYQYVGGVAGLNTGTITNTNNDVELNVNTAAGNEAKYFGGVVGQNGTDGTDGTNVNDGVIENATNSNTITAPDASYVGGIVGWNTSQGKLVGMGNSNEGTVIGGSYVGGVIGKNDAAIGGKNNAQVGITNEGTVIATKGGAGGLIGENNAAITNTVMINRGEVHGNNSNDGSGTGGLIGTNNENGDITYSSLINEVTGTVTGTNNVGGLIGVNKADITGGRYTVAGEDAGMYINKIYNNGVINVGTYGDTDNDGDYEFTAGTGQNIGGLIGDNQGSLTAGYNTGAINASGSTNVGGIAGSNSGTIDQVFNTVMTPDNAVKPDGSKQEASITGGTNVGGLVGNNQSNGEIRNAYNTSTVTATGVSGNLVGTNSGTVQYVYGYGVDRIDELIGEVTVTGSISHGHAIGAAENSWFQQDVYDGFNFGANGWKIYNGSTLPMLSVFLTKVTVVDQNLVDQYFSAKHYGEFHQITADDIKALIAIGAISAPDGFGAFNNNNGLIQGVADDAMANSGNWLYSDQIADSFVNGIFNPNNLGYDISLVYSPFELDNDPSSHWNYLFNDAPFDRNKDFRERKAEVNFVDGGMEI